MNFLTVVMAYTKPVAKFMTDYITKKCIKESIMNHISMGLIPSTYNLWSGKQCVPSFKRQKLNIHFVMFQWTSYRDYIPFKMGPDKREKKKKNAGPKKEAVTLPKQKISDLIMMKVFTKTRNK